ncbi:hypothetical protein [Tepidibacter sp. Z1-5]|uniref:hypothetical protein n=1 Tax=Tepidibacter sp. Z1-5 TaxID=3134138 RepID=UPI0030C59BA2
MTYTTYYKNKETNNRTTYYKNRETNNHTTYYKNRETNNRTTLIRGCVCSWDGKPIEDAIIILQKCNPCKRRYEYIGYVISGHNGEFCLTIEDIYSYYKLIIYDSKLNEIEYNEIKLL